MSRKAHDDFDALGDLVAEVTGMTHFVDAKAIDKRFHDSASGAETDLGALKAAALSPEMSALAQKAIERFAKWRGQAEILLGLKPAKEIIIPEVLQRDGDGIKSLLNQALALSGRDAETRIAEAGEAAQKQTIALMALAIALAAAGCVGAFWLARNLSEPLRDLVASAERLAAGDVSVTFAALGRRDEIGEISLAVARFRDNVTAARDADADAAAHRAAAETERERAASQRSRAASEQADVVRRLGDGLKRLSSGDLRIRLGEGFSDDYAQIRDDFNEAINILKQTVQSVVTSADAIQSGTHEISSASDDLSRRTEQQAASLEETAAALDEITATVRKSAEGAHHAREVVAAADDDARKSAVVVRQAVEAMGAIAKSSRQVGQVIGVIDEIAFQTNLLALNAGVEAARAGEAGKGFAVVASEVRALAQRAAEAAKEIKGLISASTMQVDQGVKLVTETGASLERIMAKVTEINAVVGDIAVGAKEQAAALGEVNSAINQMDQATQQNAAMVEESTAAGRALSKETSQLCEIISQFQIDQATDDAMRRQLRDVAPHAFRSPAKAASVARAETRKTAPPSTRPARKAVVNGAAADWQEF